VRGDEDGPLLEHPLPDLVQRVTGRPPSGPRQHLQLGDLGVRSTQRLAVCDHGGGIAVFTWPAELQPQARYLYAEGRGRRLLDAAAAGAWDVDARPHLAFRNAGFRLRLYMNPTLSTSEYVARWSGPDRDFIRQHPPETVRGELWPWLRARGHAGPEDDGELDRFLRNLGQRPAHLRPGLRLLRRWPRDQVAALREDGALETTLRAEVNRLLRSVGDPELTAV
jgi:hypothetical protein